MIAQEYKKMLGAKSVIREMFTYGTERAKEIGKENMDMSKKAAGKGR